MWKFWVLQYKYLRKKMVHFVVVECCELGIESARNEKYEFLRFLVSHDSGYFLTSFIILSFWFLIQKLLKDFAKFAAVGHTDWRATCVLCYELLRKRAPVDPQGHGQRWKLLSKRKFVRKTTWVSSKESMWKTKFRSKMFVTRTCHLLWQ